MLLSIKSLNSFYRYKTDHVQYIYLFIYTYNLSVYACIRAVNSSLTARPPLIYSDDPASSANPEHTEPG